MKEKTETSLYIRVIEFTRKHPQGFKYGDLIDNEKFILQAWERNIVDRHFFNACQRYHHNNNTIGETIFQFIEGNKDQHNSTENRYILGFETEFTYIDYQELKFARENAKSAKNLSWIAIGLSLLAVVVSTAIPFMVANKITQSVKIDNVQLEELKAVLNRPK